MPLQNGIFFALEVVTILNYLQVCDNPLQDIPLTGVLRSPLVGCTTQELAVLRERTSEGDVYDSVLNFLKEYEGQERTLYQQITWFYSPLMKCVILRCTLLSMS